MSTTYSATESYTVADVEAAFRRFRADIFMIADSTGAVTRDKADDYAHDAEYLARRKYLKAVDVTLLNGDEELRAVRYTINEAAGGLASSRPGGTLWPRVAGAWLRVVLSYTAAYTPEKKSATQDSLRFSWSPTSADTSHAGLNSLTGRNYTSNAFGLERSDFGK